MSVHGHILIVDDDALLRRSLSLYLQDAGYCVSTAATAEEALALIETTPPALLLLDIGLPGMDGLEALRHLRQHTDAPVIFLTARRRELDQILGLELGADDYITKPFDVDVLVAHIRAVLRRTVSFPRQTEPLVVGDLVIDPAEHLVTIGGRAVELTPRAFDLLCVLARKIGQVFSVDDLLAQVWGAEYKGEPQVVYVNIRWLREKLEDDPSHPQRIITVRGVGYKLLAGP